MKHPRILASALALLLISIFARNVEAAASPDYARCERLLQSLTRSRDYSGMNSCMDFYFSNSEYDEESGNFGKVIRLGTRSVEVNPYQAEIYTNVSWLLWSKWVHWKEEPTSEPAGESCDDRSIAILEQGERYYRNDAKYLKDAADTIWSFAQYHQPQRYAFVIDHYERADLSSTDKDLKVRVRLNLGHIYRKLGDLPLARQWYEAVLGLDPDNQVAKNYLSQMP